MMEKAFITNVANDSNGTNKSFLYKKIFIRVIRDISLAFQATYFVRGVTAYAAQTLECI